MFYFLFSLWKPYEPLSSEKKGDVLSETITLIALLHPVATYLVDSSELKLSCEERATSEPKPQSGGSQEQYMLTRSVSLENMVTVTFSTVHV